MCFGVEVVELKKTLDKARLLFAKKAFESELITNEGSKNCFLFFVFSCVEQMFRNLTGKRCDKDLKRVQIGVLCKKILQQVIYNFFCK